MVDLLSLLTVGLSFGVMVASPGPATLAVVTVSMSAGRQSGMRFGLGLSFGHIFWGCVAATGMGAVLQNATNILVLLKLLGGGYLLWLAYCSFRSAVGTTARPINLQKGRSWFIRGLVLNLSNPKVVVAWMATLSLGGFNSQSSHQIHAATVLCIGLAFSTNAVYALLFSTDRAMLLYAKFRGWIDGVVAGVFAIVGLSLIRSALSR